MTTMKATRKAYGEALAKLGSTYPSVVSLDAETKNSTYAEDFKAAFPDRYFDCFIAEQNMVGMAVGMARMGKIPFASSFAAFFTRAYDQIRMGALSLANFKIVGSHAGVSIGQDGSSQMALEDIACMRAIWNSVVLYPSDPVATEKLVEEMILHTGFCYMRTTRAVTETIYADTESFPIGGFKIHRANSLSAAKAGKSSIAKSRRVTVISAGITLHEALKVQKSLEREVDVTVIDMYSIKPVNREALQKAVTTKHVITVEDHWFEGGIGDAVLNVFSDVPSVAVHKLAVTTLPHSGTPEENLSRAGIDASSLEKNIRTILTL